MKRVYNKEENVVPNNFEPVKYYVHSLAGDLQGEGRICHY
jgi:hypothetical protein